jgi:hypothetical protein
MRVGDIYVSNLVIMSAVTVTAITCLVFSHIKRVQAENELTSAGLKLEAAQSSIKTLTGDLQTANEKLASLQKGLQIVQDHNKTADEASSYGFGIVAICVVVGICTLIAYFVFVKNRKPDNDIRHDLLRRAVRARENQIIAAAAASREAAAAEELEQARIRHDAVRARAKEMLAAASREREAAELISSEDKTKPKFYPLPNPP